MDVVGDFSGTFYPSFLLFSFIYLFGKERDVTIHAFVLNQPYV
jgi:hypothetical protein